MSFRVRVVDDDEEPVTGATVRLSFTSMLRGITAEVDTDGDGVAVFEDYDE